MEFTSRGHNQASFRVFLGLKWVSIRKSEGITVHERFSIAYTKWLYLPYVVCRRKGAATAAARLSFLSPSLHGYPNFTPESQYLLITLEGIVLYSLLPLSLSLYPSPSQPISLFPTLSPLSLSHFLPSTTSARSFAANLSSVFFSASSLTFHPIFREKEKHRMVFAPVALSRRSQLFFAILLVLSFRGKGEAQRDENSPHDSFILGNECLPRSFGNATPLTPKFEEIRGGKQHLCERTPRPE